jgi:glycosyltransferase involved in cell wall biosynthesis
VNRQDAVEIADVLAERLRGTPLLPPRQIVRVEGEVTALMPCLNAMLTLPLAIYALARQSVPVRLLLLDQESTDGTGDYIFSKTVEAFWLSRGLREFRFLGIVKDHVEYADPNVRKQKNLEHGLARLCEAVETPYTLFVDADVECPPGGVRDMQDALKADAKIGMVGFCYEDADHLQLGCSMMPTEIAKSLAWRTVGCPCRWANDEIVRMGYRVERMNPLSRMARHLKREV